LFSSPLSIFPKTAPVSPYANNYGYGTAPPAVSEAERQWYISNGYGDPLATSGSYYKGVNTIARDRYLGAAAESEAVRQQTALYSSAPKAAGGTMTYAGSALGIPA
jgi:hypothetical protein